MHDRVEQRMGWIEASLRFAGQFASGEKAAYMERFGVKPAQVSYDQDTFCQEFNARCGAAVTEVTKGKVRGVPSAALPSQPIFRMPSMTDWLQSSMRSGFLKVEAVRRAEPDLATLRSVVVAVRKRMPLEIVYLSRSSGRSRKVVSPHVIVDVADRLHLRAYDHARSRFSDFVLSRIEGSGRADPGVSFVSPDRDDEWHRRVTIEIRAHADFAGERAHGVIQDFGLDRWGGRLRRERAAVAPYLVDRPTDTAFGLASPVSVRTLDRDAESRIGSP